MTCVAQPDDPHPSADGLRAFYERDFPRAVGITGIPGHDDFMYGQVLQELRPYLRPGLSALDLGCGDGNLSLYMARSGCEVLGIDLARNAVEAAVRSAAFYGIDRARFRAIDFAREWDEPEAFDLVLCSHVIEHVPDDAGLLARVHLALRPGGRLLLLTPTVYSSFARLSRWLTGRVAHDERVGHLRGYTGPGIETLVARAGFVVDRVVFLDGPLRDWCILWAPLRPLIHVWRRRGIRRAFNAVDRALAARMLPAAICLHARRAASAAGEGP